MLPIASQTTGSIGLKFFVDTLRVVWAKKFDLKKKNLKIVPSS